MKLDLEFLRRHYASMSDEALMDVDRAELVEEAQRVLDEELASRDLDTEPDVAEFPAAEFVDRMDDQIDTGDRAERSEDEPDWIDESAEVYAETAYQGRPPAEHATHGRDVLEKAGIPCHLDLQEIPQDDGGRPDPTHRWRLIVPGEFSQQATNILDRDVFNPEFEEDWRNHLHSMSDEEVRKMTPQSEFMGLFDRVARITRAYNEELQRRNMK